MNGLRSTAAALLAVLSAASWDAPAASVHVVGQSHGCLIDLDGRIDRKTPRLLADAMKHAASEECLIRVNSPGGDVDAAMETGRAIRRYKAGTLVPEQSTCASSCLLLFVGGVQRQATGGFALHRAYSTQLANSADEAQNSYRDINARLRQYLDEMNIPERLLNVMNAVPPGQIRLLHGARDEGMLRELHIVGEDPAWADQRDSAEARRLGISRTEYYTRQHRAATLCDVAGATAASARERVRCRYDVLEGKR